MSSWRWMIDLSGLRRRAWLGLIALGLVFLPWPGHAEESWTEARAFGLYDRGAGGGTPAASSRNLAVAMTQGSVMVAQAGGAPGEASTNEWQFTLGAYMWMPRVEIDAKIGALSRSATIDFSDIIDDFRFGFAGHFEANRADWTALLDLFYISLRSSGGPAGQGELDYKQLFLEFGGTYRLATVPVGANGRMTFEVLAGGRLMAVDADLTVGAQSASRSATLIDPMVGGRIAYHITDTISLWFRGDVAGFDISDSQSKLTYNLIAGLNWRFAHLASVFAGWRYMHIEIDKGVGANTLNTDVSLNGPVIGLNIYF